MKIVFMVFLRFFFVFFFFFDQGVFFFWHQGSQPIFMVKTDTTQIVRTDSFQHLHSQIQALSNIVLAPIFS